jgi:hypothetical protein
VLLFSLLLSPAQADDPVVVQDTLAEKGQLDVYLLTDVPTMIGIGSTYELPSRLRGSLSMGILPAPYLDLINAAMVGFDVYTQTTADLIDILLQNSLIMKGELGWRPWPARGWYLGLGGQLIVLAGDTTELTYYSEGIDEEILETAEEHTGSLDVSVRPKMLTGHIGHEWTIKERFMIRTNLGFAYTVSASSKVSSSQTPTTRVGVVAVSTLESAAETYLNNVFTEWVHVPTVGVSAGYRF